MLMLLLWRGVSWPTLPASARMLAASATLELLGSDAASIRHGVESSSSSSIESSLWFPLKRFVRTWIDS